MCPDFDILTASCTWHTHWVSLTQYWDDDVTKWGLNFKILRRKFHEWIPYLKVPFTFNFHLSINIGTWNHNLDFFELFLGWWPRRVKTLTKFLDSGFKNEDFLKFPFTIVYHVSITVGIFHSILGEWRHHWIQNCNILRKWSNKQIPLFDILSNIDFDLSVTFDTWYTSLGPLYLI